MVDYGKFSGFLDWFFMTLATSDTVKLPTTSCFTLEYNVFVIVTTIASATRRIFVSSASSPEELGVQPMTNFYSLVVYRRG